MNQGFLIADLEQAPGMQIFLVYWHAGQTGSLFCQHSQLHTHFPFTCPCNLLDQSPTLLHGWEGYKSHPHQYLAVPEDFYFFHSGAMERYILLQGGSIKEKLPLFSEWLACNSSLCFSFMNGNLLALVHTDHGFEIVRVQISKPHFSFDFSF